MLSVTRHSSHLTSKILPHRVAVRSDAVKFNRKYHAKVSALPFAFSWNEAVKQIAPWVSLNNSGKGLVKSLLAKYLPGSELEPLPPDDLLAVYIPVWFIDGEATGTINKSGTEVPVTVQSLNSYMPGLNDFDPLSTLSLSQPTLEKLAVPFTPELRRQHGIDVACLPHSISPLPLPEIVKSLTPSQCKLADSITFTPKSVEFSMLAVYPVLLPIYLMKYNLKVPSSSETVALTCLLQAHAEDGLAYIENGTWEVGGLIRKELGAMPGSWFHKFLLPAGEKPHWEQMSGTHFGFSSVGIPVKHPGFDLINKAITDFLDQGIWSNMATLRKYGVDMDHPCVRMFTREEVDANRKFLVASREHFSMRELHKKIASGVARASGIVIDANGKRVVMHDGIRDLLGKRSTDLEKKKEDLRPQWVKDWQDSRAQ